MLEWALEMAWPWELLETWMLALAQEFLQVLEWALAMG